MLRVNIYIPEETDRRIEFIARSIRKNKAEVVRSALEAGLKFIHPKSFTAEKLLKFAKAAEKIPMKGKAPKDIVRNMDYYTWGGEKHA